MNVPGKAGLGEAEEFKRKILQKITGTKTVG